MKSLWLTLGFAGLALAVWALSAQKDFGHEGVVSEHEQVSSRTPPAPGAGPTGPEGRAPIEDNSADSGFVESLEGRSLEDLEGLIRTLPAGLPKDQLEVFCDTLALKRASNPDSSWFELQVKEMTQVVDLDSARTANPTMAAEIEAAVSADITRLEEIADTLCAEVVPLMSGDWREHSIKSLISDGPPHHSPDKSNRIARGMFSRTVRSRYADWEYYHHFEPGRYPVLRALLLEATERTGKIREATRKIESDYK